MDLELNDRIALVTGASRGIGHATAALLAEEGARVAVTARSGAALDAWAGHDPRRLALPDDLRDPSAAERLVDATVDHFGGLDLIVHCAGATVRGDFLTLGDEAWDDGFARVNDLVLERRGITADTALRLARCFSTTGEFWMNLQIRYELETARREVGTLVEQRVEVMNLDGHGHPG